MNGLVTDIEVPADKDSGKFKISFQEAVPGGKKSGEPSTMEFDFIIGSDGANSRVAKVRGVLFWFRNGKKSA